MRNILIGVVLGICIATVGFSGIARILDNSVTKLQSVTKDAAE
jgi:capsular polysaccharide biosynthesis protein